MHDSPGKPRPTTRSPQLAADGSLETGNLRVPFSTFATDEARDAFLTELQPPPPEAATDLTALRTHYEKFNDRLRDQMLERFHVEIEETEFGGVPAQVVTPGKLAGDGSRVLLNLHGGAFMWGAGSGALVEAIPVAATSGIPVIAVDYRLAPEHTFPAATDDVQAVYEALIATRPARAIGMYGCSAGAILAAQCVAQFLDRGLPLPGGIAMLGGAGLTPLGDSAYTSKALSGEGGDGEDADVGMRDVLRSYVPDLAPDDPRVTPGVNPQLVRQFPPSLLITGSRDFAASSVTTMHRRLVAQQVHAELFVFDGMWHAFHIFPHLPESREVYGLLADFFARTLTTRTE